MWLLRFKDSHNFPKKLAKDHRVLVRYLEKEYSQVPWEFHAIDDKTISVVDSSMPEGSKGIGFIEFTEVIE